MAGFTDAGLPAVSAVGGDDGREGGELSLETGTPKVLESEMKKYVVGPRLYWTRFLGLKFLYA